MKKKQCFCTPKPRHRPAPRYRPARGPRNLRCRDSRLPWPPRRLQGQDNACRAAWCGRPKTHVVIACLCGGLLALANWHRAPYSCPPACGLRHTLLQSADVTVHVSASVTRVVPLLSAESKAHHERRPNAASACWLHSFSLRIARCCMCRLSLSGCNLYQPATNSRFIRATMNTGTDHSKPALRHFFRFM
jgi:hypothetical protein